jgi:RNA polymerase sigma-54 factor
LQELSPGIATGDVRTCLLAQLDSLDERGQTCPYVREIISGHLDALGARQYKRIAQALGIPIDHIEAAHDFVQRNLWPYPVLPSCDFDSAWQSTTHSLPDVAIVAQGCDFAVDMLHSPRRILRLNPLYQDLARRAVTLDDATREHVQGYIRRARIFLTNLRQREKTMQQIVETIVEHQEAFLRYGMRHLRPLTRAAIAAELGVHESTVSRAIANKLVLLPNGVPLPMSEFFVAARSAQDALRELIRNENRPYSDAQLARLLNEQGFRITRRTVAKYRDQMRILPSRLR